MAWTVGINLTLAQPTALVGEAAVFVLSGLGAYAGLKLGGKGPAAASPAAP